MKRVAQKQLKKFEQVKDIKILENSQNVQGYQITTDLGTYEVKGNSKKQFAYSSGMYGVNGAAFEFKTMDNLPVALAVIGRSANLFTLL